MADCLTLTWLYSERVPETTETPPTEMVSPPPELIAEFIELAKRGGSL